MPKKTKPSMADFYAFDAKVLHINSGQVYVEIEQLAMGLAIPEGLAWSSACRLPMETLVDGGAIVLAPNWQQLAGHNVFVGKNLANVALWGE